MSADKLIFKGKSLEDLYKEIYDNSNNTRKQIKGIIKELKDTLGESREELNVVSPVILEYLEVGVKNDEQLLKLANLISRTDTSKANDTFDLSDFHKLMEEQEALSKEIEKKKE